MAIDLPCSGFPVAPAPHCAAPPDQQNVAEYVHALRVIARPSDARQRPASRHDCVIYIRFVGISSRRNFLPGGRIKIANRFHFVRGGTTINIKTVLTIEKLLDWLNTATCGSVITFPYYLPSVISVYAATRKVTFFAVTFALSAVTSSANRDNNRLCLYA